MEKVPKGNRELTERAPKKQSKIAARDAHRKAEKYDEK